MLATVVDELRESDPDSLTERFRTLELERRRIKAEMAAVVAEVERHQIYTADGHRSISGWLRANANWSNAQAARCRRAAKLIDSIPDVGEALHAGRIGTAQVDELARARANPRCGDRLVDSIDILLEHAEHLSFGDSTACIRHWENLADLDGAHRDRAANVEHRRAIVTGLSGGVFIEASGGTALEADELTQIFDHFVEREFDADAAERLRLYGADAPASLLPRTDAQRRFDATLALFRAAGANPELGKPAGFVVNLVSDQSTFEFALAAHGLGDPPDNLPERDLLERRCETVGGVAVLPDDLVRAALAGHVRRVVIDSAGVITDAGRQRRLFTGVLRDLAKLMGRRCNHPGCTVGATYSDVDHLDEWDRDDGRTDLANSGVRCNTHNRFKHRQGVRVRRDRIGRLVTFRADGTPILPVGRTPPDDNDFLSDRDLAELTRRRLFAEIGRSLPD